MEIDANNFRDQVVPLPNHPCFRCKQPGRYREPYTSLDGPAPRWLCEECYKLLTKPAPPKPPEPEYTELDDQDGARIRKALTGEDRERQILYVAYNAVKSGASPDAVLRAAQSDNTALCDPPLPESVVCDVVERARARAAADGVVQLGEIDSTIFESTGKTRHYRNDRERGIVVIESKFMADGPAVSYEHIFSWYLCGAERVENPADPLDTLYNLEFLNPKTGKKQVYESFSISEVVNDISNTKGGVKSKGKLHEALSSLLQSYEDAGVISVKRRIPATGFFEDEGMLQYHESREYPIPLPEYSVANTRLALTVLGELLEFYGPGDHIKTMLYFAVQAPLSFVRKMHGREAKLLLAWGTPHVGKTQACKLLGALWGLTEDRAVVGASSLTPPQLATILNNSTMPVFLDEVRRALSDPYIADMLKSSTTATRIKDRIRSDRGFRREVFHAYAGCGLTCNYVPGLYVGISERLIPVQFTPAHRRTDEAVEQYMQRYHMYRDLLPHIGAALKEMYLTHWDEVRAILLDGDQVNAGQRLLLMLYAFVGLPVPEWVTPVTVREKIEPPDPVEMLMDFLKSEYLGVIERNRGTFSDISDWTERLLMMNSTALLPPHTFRITMENVSVKNNVLSEMTRKTQYEPPHNLEGYTHLIPGSKYTEEAGSRMLRIPTGTVVQYFSGSADIAPGVPGNLKGSLEYLIRTHSLERVRATIDELYKGR